MIKVAIFSKITKSHDLENNINDFINDKHVIDIKYQSFTFGNNIVEKAMVIYEEGDPLPIISGNSENMRVSCCSNCRHVYIEGLNNYYTTPMQHHCNITGETLDTSEVYSKCCEEYERM